jgi:hypothetical protein
MANGQHTHTYAEIEGTPTIPAPFDPSQLVGSIDKLRADLNALSAKVDKLTPPPVDPPPAPEVFEAIDFAKSNAGHLFAGSVVGKGPAVTTYRVKPGSSTKTPPTTGTNPFRIVRVGGTGGALVKGVRVADLTVEGYEGHNTHGLTVGYTDGAVVENVHVNSIKGSSTTPPGETFSLELWNAMGPIVRNVVIDGEGVASSMLGIMNTEGGTFEDIVAMEAHGFGAAIWQSGNLVLRDVDLRNSRRAMNFEQCYGTILIERVDLRGRTSARNTGPDIVVATAGYTPIRGPLAGRNQSSAKVRIVDPEWDRAKGPLIVGVPGVGANYPAIGRPHSQRPEDVTVVIDGKSYTGPQNGTNGPVKIGGYWNG